MLSLRQSTAQAPPSTRPDWLFSKESNFYYNPNTTVQAIDAPVSRMHHVDLKALETRVDELIRACDELRDENRALRGQQGNLVAERANLIEKSELARSRVESMIARLKAMELGA